MVVLESWAVRSVPLRDRLLGHLSAAKEIAPAVKDSTGVRDPINPSLSLAAV